MRLVRYWCWLPALMVVSPLWADVQSGPTVGDKTPALKVFAVTGAVENKEVDYAAERKDKPTIYIFVQTGKDDAAKGGSIRRTVYLKELDKIVKKVSDDGYIVVVWLIDDQDRTKKWLSAGVKFENTAMTIFQGDKTGPKEWKVSVDAQVTVVVTNQQKVTAAFGHLSSAEEDVRKVEEALKKAVGK